jgi:hypothetical protein
MTDKDEPPEPTLDKPPEWLLVKKVKFFNWKNGKGVFEVLAGFAFLFVLVIGLFFWRVSTSPLDMAFAKPYVEEALTNQERGLYTSLDSIILHWPDLAGPLELDVRGAKVLGPDKSVIVAVDEASITLSKAGFFIGRILPVGLTLKHPEVTLIRSKEGKINIGFGGAPKTQEDVEDQTDLAERILQHVARPGNESGSPLATLKSFEIVDAQVNIDDRQSGTFSYLPEVNVIFQSTPAGLDADMFVSFDDTPEWPSFLRASLLIPWESDSILVDATLENFDLSFVADKIPALAILDNQDVEIDGRFYGLLDKNFMPSQAQLVASSASGAFVVPEFSEGKVPYEDFTFELAFNGEAGTVEVLNTQVTVKDVTLQAEAALKANEREVSGPIKFSIDKLKQSQIKPLWPKALEGDNAEEWIVDKMSEGTFHDVTATIDFFALKGEEEWDIGVEDVVAGFSFENMSVDYRPPMTPVKKAKGSGIFRLAEEKLSVDITDAMIGDLKVNKGELEFVNIIEAGKGKADIRVALEGPLKSGFQYLTKEPIALKHDFDLEKVQGTAQATVNVRFPTKDISVKDVQVNAEGTMSDVTLPGVMKVLELTGGPLNFTVKDNEFILKGDAKIAGQDAKVDYREFLESEGKAYKSKVVASLLVNTDMRNKLGINLADFLDGDALVDVTYTEYPGGKAQADLNVDLKPTFVYFKPLGYEKKAGDAGSATLKATLQNGELQKISELKATATNMQIDNASFNFGAGNVLTGGTIPSFAINESVAKMDFSVGTGGRYKINIDGSFFDLRPSLDGEKKEGEVYDESPMDIAIKADRMRAADTDTLQHARMELSMDGTGAFDRLEFDGTAGKGNVTIRFRPDEGGKRVFYMKADDAGATLRAFGVYDNIVGGVLEIAGDPIKGVHDRNVRGLAQIRDFKVVKAPTLARLLGMLSLPGVMSALKDDGLTFSKLEAKFDWLYRPKGSLLVLKDGRTSGNSVGFTFDGTYDKSAGKIDIEGTMIPLSGVNKVIGNIPLVGDILTGGSGGVIAATYSVKGEAKSPSVFVNPLSVLTPGILRRILFEN